MRILRPMLQAVVLSILSCGGCAHEAPTPAVAVRPEIPPCPKTYLAARDRCLGDFDCEYEAARQFQSCGLRAESDSSNSPSR